jgi:hypothetical protein
VLVGFVGRARRTLPGVISPLFSASVIMLRAILSFTLEQGSMDSSLAATFAPESAGTTYSTAPSIHCALCPETNNITILTLVKYTSGVLPIRSVTLAAIWVVISWFAIWRSTAERQKLSEFWRTRLVVDGVVIRAELYARSLHVWRHRHIVNFP